MFKIVELGLSSLISTPKLKFQKLKYRFPQNRTRLSGAVRVQIAKSIGFRYKRTNLIFFHISGFPFSKKRLKDISHDLPIGIYEFFACKITPPWVYSQWAPLFIGEKGELVYNNILRKKYSSKDELQLRDTTFQHHQRGNHSHRPFFGNLQAEGPP